MKVPVGTTVLRPGDFCWNDETNPEVILIEVPSVGMCRLQVVKGDAPRAPVWGWDGNLEQPTLTPSIDIKSGTGAWHGYLQNGKLIPA